MSISLIIYRNSRRRSPTSHHTAPAEVLAFIFRRQLSILMTSWNLDFPLESNIPILHYIQESAAATVAAAVPGDICKIH